VVKAMDIPINQFNLSMHVMSCASSDVLDIAKPIYQMLKLNHFSYMKLFPGKKAAYLTTDPLVHEIFIRNKFFEECYIDHIDKFQSGFFLWDQINNKRWIATLKNDFNISNGLVISKKNYNLVEFCYFATTPNNTAINHFYLHHPEIFKNFFHYFKEKAISLINAVEKDPLVYPSEARDKTILTATTIDNKVQLATSNIANTLSPREHDCLKHLAHGKSIKETANILNISPRTAETYLIQAKRKINLYSTSSLIDWYWKTLS
jgi:DNA-binding CsgD family transcriptional regulator